MSLLQPKEQLSLDAAQEQGFISCLKNFKEKSPATIRIFDRGEYFTVHGEDALFAAKDFFHTNSVIKYLGSGENKVPSVILSKLNFESFVHDLLLIRQYRVEVYKQKTAGKNDWEETYKASPGNFAQFEDILFGSGTSVPIKGGVMALKLKIDGGKKLVGAAHIDMNEQVMMVSEFYDADSFVNLEALTVQLGAKECIIPAGDLGSDASKIKQILTRNKLLVTEMKRAEFGQKDAVQDIGRLVKSSNKDGDSTVFSSRPEMQLVQASSALLAVVKYLELLSDESNCNQFTLKTYELAGFMQLDGAVLRALHVEPEAGAKKGERERNLFALLDKCSSAQGKRMLSQWLRQPLTDIKKIEERQDLVEMMVNNVEVRHSLGDGHLKRIPDLTRLTRKMGRKTANLQDCYRFYLCARQLPDICESLAKCQGEHEAAIDSIFITPLREVIEDLSKFQEMIEVTLDMEQAALGEFVIKPEFDENLTELRDQMNTFESEMQKQLRKAANDLCLDAGKTLKMESNSQLGYFFRVTLKEEKVLRNNKQYHMIDTNKSGVRFRNSALKELNDQHMAAKEEYETQQKSVVEEIIVIVAGYVEVIQSLNFLLGTLDCIVSLATVASSAPVPYCKPKLLPMGSGKLEFVACRHPCLELEDSVSFIPNNCSLNSDKGTFHIITGPNMGGKSTFLRSIGVAVLMAQIGSYVACDEASISIVDSILARVGAGDCQMKGVSTFMTEMLETATILRTATKNSLIIIDELGRGTSTYDGFGLAWAISEHIAEELESFCLFATHFHELTALSERVSSVKNYHVTATTINNTLTLLYQVKPGPCDRSFGIHVAKLANFPQHVIEFAKRKAEELEDDMAEDELSGTAEECLEKRKKLRKEEEQIIETYLAKFAEFYQDSLPDDQIKSELQNLKETIKTNHLIFYQKYFQ